MKFLISPHVSLNEDVIEVINDDGQTVAFIVPANNGSTLRIITERVQRKEQVSVHTAPPRFDAIAAAAQDHNLPIDSLVSSYVSTPWPAAIDVIIDLEGA